MRAHLAASAAFSTCRDPELIAMLASAVCSPAFAAAAPASRERVVGYVCRALGEWPTAAAERARGDVEKVMSRAWGDDDLGVRVAARRCFELYEATFPKRAELLLRELSPTQRELIVHGRLSVGTDRGNGQWARGYVGINCDVRPKVNFWEKPMLDPEVLDRVDALMAETEVDAKTDDEERRVASGSRDKEDALAYAFPHLRRVPVITLVPIRPRSRGGRRSLRTVGSPLARCVRFSPPRFPRFRRPTSMPFNLIRRLSTPPRRRFARDTTLRNDTPPASPKPRPLYIAPPSPPLKYSTGVVDPKVAKAKKTLRDYYDAVRRSGLARQEGLPDPALLEDRTEEKILLGDVRRLSERAEHVKNEHARRRMYAHYTDALRRPLDADGEPVARGASSATATTGG